MIERCELPERRLRAGRSWANKRRLSKNARRFALATLKLIKHLPLEEPGPLIRRQLAKSATSVSMNYRATCRARSHAEFTSKIGLVAEEADESLGWLETIGDADC